MKINVLKLYSLLIDETIAAAIEFYLNHSYWKFDPHVGDTACQIRAYKIAILAKETHKAQQEWYHIEVLKQLSYRINKLISSLTYESEHPKKGKNQQPLKEFFTEHELIYELPKDFLFLTQSFLLTKITQNDQKDNTCTNRDLLCEIMKVSRKTAKKIMQHYQTSLAKDSVTFIKSISHPLLGRKISDRLLNELERADESNRVALPCYLVTKSLLTLSFTDDIPILIIIKSNTFYESKRFATLVFKPIKGKRQFRLANPDEIEPIKNKPCIVIHGIMDGKFITQQAKEQYIKKFMDIGLVNIILSNMANHPQYFNGRLDGIDGNPFNIFLERQLTTCVDGTLPAMEYIKKIFSMEKELTIMQKRGMTKGCCRANPSLYYMRHIFCDTIEHQLSLLKINQIDNELYNPKLMDYNLGGKAKFASAC